MEGEGVVFRRLSEGGVRGKAGQKERGRGEASKWNGEGEDQGEGSKPENNGSVQGQNQFLRREPIVQNSLREDGGGEEQPGGYRRTGGGGRW